MAMKWIEPGIVLNTRTYGESSKIVTLLTQEHGRYAGLVKGQKNIPQPGNIVQAAWSARLPEQLGYWTFETEVTTAARLMNAPQRLACLATFCHLTDACLPERHPYPQIYTAALDFMHLLILPEDTWMKSYACYEILLLKDLGFGLDLSCCAATGKITDLIYVSPKSGRAVSREAGSPYHDKMLLLPDFLHNPSLTPTPDDIKTSLKLSGFFLNLHLTEKTGLSVTRQNFIDAL